MRKTKFFLSAAFAILLVITLRYFYTHSLNNLDNYVNTVEKNLTTELKKLKQDEQQLLDYFSSQPFIDFTALNKLNTHYPFYIYKKNSLVYWSNEHFLPKIDASSIEGLNFQTSEAGQSLYLIRKSKDSDVVLLWLLPLYQNYEINNEYITSTHNQSIFADSNPLLFPNNFNGALPILGGTDKALFFIPSDTIHAIDQLPFHILIIIIELLIISLVIIMAWKLLFKVNHFLIKTIGFSAMMVILWFLMDFLEIPFNAAEFDLFDPKYFASSDLNSSLGMLIINCTFFLLIGLFTLKSLPAIDSNKQGIPIHKNWVLFTLNISTYLSALPIYYYIELIYLHSNWGIDITQSIEMSFFQILTYAGLILFIVLAFQIFLTTGKYNSENSNHSKSFFITQLLLAVLFSSLSFIISYEILWFALVIFALNLILYLWKLNNPFDKLGFSTFVYLFLVVSSLAAIVTLSISNSENRKETNQRNILANRILNDNDVFAEYLLQQLDESLRNDQFITNQFLLPLSPYRTIVDKIEKYHIDDYFNKFEKNIRIFDNQGHAIYPDDALNMSTYYPLDQMGERNRRGEQNIFLVGSNDGSSLSRKYIYLYKVKFNDFNFANIVIEFKPKRIQPDNVFPELLVNKRITSGIQDNSYDYALYKNDTLSYSVGKINFPTHINQPYEQNQSLLNLQDLTNNKFNIMLDKEEVLLFSKEDRSLHRLMSNFSFFFIICFIIVFIISIIQFFKVFLANRSIGLSTKIQLYFSLAFIIPLLSVSISTVGFVNVTFLKDIVTNYQQSTNRVAAQLTPLIMNFKNGKIDKNTLNNELASITKIVNADINLFDLNGSLLMTSQPQVFDKNLLSEKVNPKAFEKIIDKGQRFITLEEKIGSLNYQSAYVGIRSYNSGELLAILGSPFFKSNKEYDELLTDLLNNVFNIFVGSFMVFMLLAYTATKILTSPLNLLKQKLSQVNLAAENKPLSWKVDDEIGLLIKEYNQMLLKLEKSRQALSRTEKESAWREMAQQVAHEIKNPLTPMKLSLQHLLMRIENSQNDLPEAVAKIKSILSQVDNLSDIATSFSSFATMPIPENEKVAVSEVLGKVVNFFQAENKGILLDLGDKEIFALADQKLLERTFNNMIINALQSKASNDEVMLKIKLSYSDQVVNIAFQDNGDGIPEEIQNKVFLPNFTTKETGSGIGLAIAKRGIEHAGGDIWFESIPNVGTTFYIELQRL